MKQARLDALSSIESFSAMEESAVIVAAQSAFSLGMLPDVVVSHVKWLVARILASNALQKLTASSSSTRILLSAEP